MGDNIPTPFCSLDMLQNSGYLVNKKTTPFFLLFFSKPPSSPAFLFKKKILGSGSLPRERVFVCICVHVCVGGGENEKRVGSGRGKRLTGRNPNKILCPLCYDVGISCSEKQLPGMDQSIRYISYFSKRKRGKKERKPVSLFLYI